MTDPDARQVSLRTASLAATTPRALVVEDDAGIRTLASAILRREKFAVDEAENGRNALELLRENSAYEVIVLDLAMPEMSGLALISYLRDYMPATLRRIVVMTASLHVLREQLPAGVCRVMTKPFDIQEFVDAVKDCAGAE